MPRGRKKGFKHSEETKIKIGLGHLKEKIGYFALHVRVNKKLGKANKCSNLDCVYPRKDGHNKIMLAPKKFEWANISGKYKEDIFDWISLCTSCHQKFDKTNIKTK